MICPLSHISQPCQGTARTASILFSLIAAHKKTLTLYNLRCLFQVDMSNKSEEFVELYHSIIPDRDVRERVPVLVHGPKRLVDHTTIVVCPAQACGAQHTGQGPT
jgi:hypothetical protein